MLHGYYVTDINRICTEHATLCNIPTGTSTWKQGKNILNLNPTSNSKFCFPYLPYNCFLFQCNPFPNIKA